MRVLAISLMLLGFMGTSGGCGDDGGSIDAGHDQSVSLGDLAFEPGDAGLADFSGIDAVGVCTYIANDAKAVATVSGQGNLPIASGGAIADGVYFLVALQRYAGSTLPSTTMRRTIRISGGATTFEDVIDYGSQAPEMRERYTITNPGTEVSLTSVMCDEPSVVVTYGYSVSGRSLLLIDTSGMATYTFELE